MLVVFLGIPVTSPTETMLYEETIRKVASSYFIGEQGPAIDIRLSRRRLHLERAVLLARDAGIVERIDVDGHSAGMLRQLVATCYLSIAVARRVVGLHGAFVVVIILGDGSDALDGVFGPVERSKDFTQVASDVLVADDGALMRHPIAVDVFYA